MKTRIISAVIGLPILIYVVFVSGILLQVSIMALALIGTNEFYNAISLQKSMLKYIGLFFAGLISFYTVTDMNLEPLTFEIILVIFLIVLLIYLVINNQKTDIYKIAYVFFGAFYVAYLLSHIYLVRELPNGKYLVWLIFITAFASDTFAYFTGITLGKNKLCPVLSPNKTIEGSIGGILGSVVLSLLYGYFIKDSVGLEIDNATFVCVILGVVGAIFAQLGDLAASAIKRFTKIKDYGYIIPGHGGIMDRFDSVMFTAPTIYIALVFIG